MSPRVRWIVAIVGLLAGNVIAMIILATVANVGHSEVIPDYYQQASHHDDTMAEAAASRALAWRVDATLVAGELAVSVRDASGLPVLGAQVRVTGYPRASAHERLDVALVAGGAGEYRGHASDRRGLHDLAIAVVRGGQRFVGHVVVEAR